MRSAADHRSWNSKESVVAMKLSRTIGSKMELELELELESHSNSKWMSQVDGKEEKRKWTRRTKRKRILGHTKEEEPNQMMDTDRGKETESSVETH